MNKAELLFHIAKQDGLEFVFTSGNALSYPAHTHISVYTITVVRKGIVRLVRKYSTNVYISGNVYVVSPYEPHSPTYGDSFDIVSLCINKNYFHDTKRVSLIERCLKYACLLVERNKLCAETVRLFLTGIDEIYNSDAVISNIPIVKPSILRVLEFQNSEGAADKTLLHLSRFHFIRKFKHETGLTPHQYNIQSRIREAKNLLMTEATIADAALLAGFCDQSHLNRWFNRSIGITPQQYKKSCLFLDG